MKTISLLAVILLTSNVMASETKLICNDQNSHAVYELTLSENLETASLSALLADSSVLSAGTKTLKYLEGESAPAMATFAGKTNNGLSVALLFDAQKAASLKPSEILDVDVYHQQFKNDILSGRTQFLCSKN